MIDCELIFLSRLRLFHSYRNVTIGDVKIDIICNWLIGFVWSCLPTTYIDDELYTDIAWFDSIKTIVCLIRVLPAVTSKGMV